MIIASRILAVIVAFGGLLGLAGAAVSLATLSRMGHLADLIAPPGGYVFIAQHAVSAALNACAIALAPLVFFATEREA